MDQTLGHAQGVPFRPEILTVGRSYITRNNMIRPCPAHPNFLTLADDEKVFLVLSRKQNQIVLEFRDTSTVEKSGTAVQNSEMEAMRLVDAQVPLVPIPTVTMTHFDNGSGMIQMIRVPGQTLAQKWHNLDDQTKAAICHRIWRLIGQCRTIFMPETIQARGLYACLADGSSLKDPLLGDERARSRPIKSDDHFRARIQDSYLYYHQTERHPSAEEMIEYRALGMELPRSPGSVFTHGNITPDNIMVDDNNEITGILDWKVAGWYPSYWEYAQIMRVFIPFGDWSVWMDRTATRRWDVRSIEKVRQVLYTHNSTRGNY